jgi:O-antigen/teichoic acid export membrane protein
MKAARPDTPQRRGLGFNISALAGGQAVTWLMSLAWTLVVPRLLGPAQMGIVVTAVSVSAIIGLVLGLGSRDFLVREIVASRKDGPSLVGTTLVLRACLVPLYIGALVLYQHVAHLGEEATLVLYLVAGASLCWLIADPIQGTFQALERMEYLAFGMVLDETTQAVLGISLAVLGFGAVGLTAASLVIAALAVPLYLHWVRPHMRIELRTDLRKIRTLVKGSAPYWACGVFFMIYLWIDSAMLAALAPAAVVGWYGVATRLFTAMMFVPTILATAWLPRLVAAFQESPARLRAAARTPVELVFVLSLPICVEAAMTAHSVIPLVFGGSYRPAVPAMMILALCLPPMYLNIMLNQALIAAKRPLVWTWLMAAATVVNPLLNLWLIRAGQARFHNGAIGAAVALLVTELLVLAGGVIIIGRRVLTRTSLWRFARAGLAAAAMWGVMHTLGSFGFVVAAAGGGVSFLCLAAILRLASADELTMLRAAGQRVWKRSSSSEVGGP